MTTHNQETENNKPTLVKALKDLGYKINNIVALVGISRATFYKKVDNPPLSLLQAIRAVTTPRLDDYFPNLKATPYPVASWHKAGQVAEYDPNYKLGEITEQKYQQLLKEYKDLIANCTELTRLLIEVANTNTTKGLKQSISNFIAPQQK